MPPLSLDFIFMQTCCLNCRTVNKANLQLTTLLEISRYSRDPCSLQVIGWAIFYFHVNECELAALHWYFRKNQVSSPFYNFPSIGMIKFIGDIWPSAYNQWNNTSLLDALTYTIGLCVGFCCPLLVYWDSRLCSSPFSPQPYTHTHTHICIYMSIYRYI